MSASDLAGGERIVGRSAAVTHTGLARELNEDAYVCDDSRSLWAVADGMGGHARGEVASAVVVEHIGNVRTQWPTPRALAEDVIARLEEANSTLRRQARENGLGTMGATFACLVCFNWNALVTWCGDCRVYRLRERQPIRRITHDHTLVQQLVDDGRLSPDEAESHPEAHVLTRAVGAADRLELGFQQLDLRRGDLFVLCSDGLTRFVPEPEIEAVYRAEAEPRRICARLLERTLDAGAPDNVTVAAVAFS